MTLEEIADRLREPVDILLRAGNQTAVADLLRAYAGQADAALYEEITGHVVITSEVVPA